MSRYKRLLGAALMSIAEQTLVKTTRYIYWQDDDMWLGYLEDYPDYMTQGESLDDLQTHLKDLYEELTEGHIPGARKVAELQVA